MLRVNTQTVVACMAHAHPMSDFAECVFVCFSVRHLDLFCSRNTPVSAIRACGANPFPTSIVLNFVHKQHPQRVHRYFPGVVMLAILQPSAPSPPWPLASQGESRLLMPSESSLARSTGNTQWQDCYLMARQCRGLGGYLISLATASATFICAAATAASTAFLISCCIL